MKSYRRYTGAVLGALTCLMAASLLSCSVAAVPGRFTYIVKYEVTSNAAVSVDIDYKDETSTTINVVGQAVNPATPWSYEFPAAFDYDDPPFYATLDVTAPVLVPNNEIKAKIIWKDYRLDFQEEVLVLGSLYNDNTVVVNTVSLTGPELPRP